MSIQAVTGNNMFVVKIISIVVSNSEPSTKVVSGHYSYALRNSSTVLYVLYI